MFGRESATASFGFGNGFPGAKTPQTNQTAELSAGHLLSVISLIRIATKLSSGKNRKRNNTYCISPVFVCVFVLLNQKSE